MKTIAPLLCATFKVVGEDDHNGLYDRRYRVTRFYKEIKKPVFDADDFLSEMLWDSQADAHPDTIMIVPCLREEAEFVGGAGVAGTIQRIEDIIVTGMVNWSKEKIKQETVLYRESLSRPHVCSPFAIKNRWVK